MPRLRRVDCSTAGFIRRRRGRGWAYYDWDGNLITDPQIKDRIDKLAIPPAWKDVWICPIGNGHIQATGLDARDRRQYRYHDAWRQRQDRLKFEKVLDFAQALIAARPLVTDQLADHDLTKERVLACAVRLLDLGFFRIGGEEYAEQNQSFGLATMRREHVTVSRDGVITFDYPAKHGKQRVQSLADPAVAAVVRSLKRRRGGGDELLAYRTADGNWIDVRSDDINGYIQDLLGDAYSAKDFRTWSATVLCAVGLAVSEPAAASKTASKRAVHRVVKEVAHYLGNTPAVARASYIDPRVIDLYQGGVTVSAALGDIGATDTSAPGSQGAIEEAVLALLRDPSAVGRLAG